MTLGRKMNCLAAVLLAMALGPAHAGQDFVPLAVRYLEVRSDGHTAPRSAEWYFMRATNQVEIGRGGGYVELWQRDERGEVSWQRIFHGDRKLIVYTPGQLRTENRALPWETLNSVIDPQTLQEFVAMGKTEFLGRQATRYTGKIGALDVEVVWLDAEQLPASVTHRDRVHTYYHLSLEELRSEPAADWPRSDLARADGYDYIDGSDLGDREYDPFVQKVLAMDGHSHGHAH